jgi:hypothetical protein
LAHRRTLFICPVPKDHSDAGSPAPFLRLSDVRNVQPDSLLPIWIRGGCVAKGMWRFAGT